MTTNYLEGPPAYFAAPVGTVADNLVKVGSDSWVSLTTGFNYTSYRCYSRRKVVRQFKLGDTITAPDILLLPVGSEIASTSGRWGAVRYYDGWGYSDSNDHSMSQKAVDEWVATNAVSLRAFPGLPEVYLYTPGNTIKGQEMYDNAPVGTQTTNGWLKTDKGWAKWGVGSMYRVLFSARTLAEPVGTYTPPATPKPENKEVTVKYRYNSEKGTVYFVDGGWNHRDFGRVVKRGEHFLAVPNRAVREFDTEQEAIEWLL